MSGATTIYRFEVLQSAALLAFRAKVDESKAELVDMEGELDSLTKRLEEIEARRKQTTTDALHAMLDVFKGEVMAKYKGLDAKISDRRQEVSELERSLRDDPNLIPVDYLIGPGLGLNGKLYYAYYCKGASGGIEASFNPLGVFGINFKLSGSLSAGGAKQRSLVVYRGPSFVAPTPTSRLIVPNPLQINSFVGKTWGYSISGGLELSAGWEFRAGVTVKNDGGETGYDYEPTSQSTTERDQKQHEEKATELEMVGIGLEAKVGVRVGGTYKYDVFYAEDLFPLRYGVGDFNSTLRGDFAEILREGSTKTMIKERACALMQANPQIFHESPKDLQLHRNRLLWETTRSSDYVVTILWKHLTQKKLREAPPDQRPIFRRAVALAHALERYAPPDEFAVKLRAYNLIREFNLDIRQMGQTITESNPEKITWQTFRAILGGQIASIGGNIEREAIQSGIDKDNARAMGADVSRDVGYCFTWVKRMSVDAAAIQETLKIISEHLESNPRRVCYGCCHNPMPQSTPQAILDYFASSPPNLATLGASTRPKRCPAVVSRHTFHLCNDEPEDSLTFLHITADESQGEGSAFATASVEAQALVVGGTAKVEASYGYGKMEKTSRCRFQTATALLDSRSPEHETVVTSFETVIVYAQERLGPKVELEADLRTPVKNFNINQIEPVRKVKERIESYMDEKSWTRNSLRYNSTVATWMNPNLRTGAEGSARLLVGSGVSFGASFVVDSLRSLYTQGPKEIPGAVLQACYEAHAANLGGASWRKSWEDLWESSFAGGPWGIKNTLNFRYLQMITDQLHVARGLPKDAQYPAVIVIAQFLHSAKVRQQLRRMDTDALDGTSSVLLEATYRLTAPEDVNIGWIRTSDADRPHRRVIALNGRASSNILDAPRQLESLRLRFRKGDHVNKSREFFSLGFSVAGTGLSVKLATIDKAGHEGIVDLVTLFFSQSNQDRGEFVLKLPPDDPIAKAEQYDTAVPAAPLFCQ